MKRPSTPGAATPIVNERLTLPSPAGRDSIFSFSTPNHPGTPDTDSTQVSPFGLPKTRPKLPTHNSASSISNRPHRVLSTSLVSSPLGPPTTPEACRHHPRNVSDWNERVIQEKAPYFNFPQSVADPPRPARDGHEWVWFPEGYWAERERHDDGKRKRKKTRWFRERNGSDSKQSKSADKSRETSRTRTEKGSINSQNTQASKFRRGLKLMSPTQSHFLSPTSDTESLYYKLKRNFVPKKLRGDNLSDTTPIPGVPSRTTLTLQGTSIALNRKEKARQTRELQKSGLAFQPQSPTASFESRNNKGFGSAPWHRSSSHESRISVTSSVRSVLRGMTPSATPNPERSADAAPGHFYTAADGKKYSRVEISHAEEPNFLPSEARRILTPPGTDMTPESNLGFFLNDLSTEGHRQSQQSDSTLITRAGPIDVTRSRSQTSGSREAKPRLSSTSVTSRKLVAGKPNWHFQFELDVPAHLPNSPLCPKHPQHKSGGKGICVIHGRKKRSPAPGEKAEEFEPSGEGETDSRLRSSTPAAIRVQDGSSEMVSERVYFRPWRVF